MPDQKSKLRERVLTLPVMTAMVVSLVWRRIPSLTEVLRVLTREGLWWVHTLTVSKQALSKRLEKIPAALFAHVFQEVISRIQLTRRPQEPLLPGQEAGAKVQRAFSASWIADGSTLEALKKKLDRLEEPTSVLDSKMLRLVEAFTHVPVPAWYTTEAAANANTCWDKLVEKLSVGGLLIFDLGFFHFCRCDALTAAQQFFVTRLREKTASRVVTLLSQGPCYRDEILQRGLYRFNPCQYPVRKVSV
jgi:hypothetical protein